MANEATNITLLGNKGDPVEYTIATGSPIPKGSLMVFDDTPQVVKIHTVGSQFFAGIAAEEHVSGTALQASAKLACITHCIADLTAGSADAYVFGVPVCTSEAGLNTIGSATNDSIEGMAMVVGISQETVAANGTGAVKINVGKSW